MLKGNFAAARFVLKRWLKGIRTLHCVQCQRRKGFNLQTHCYTCQLANIKKALFEETEP
jgi:hypothetical protein